MASQKYVARGLCFTVFLLFQLSCAANQSCLEGADTCQDTSSMLQVNVHAVEVNLHNHVQHRPDTKDVAVSKDVHAHEEPLLPQPESLTFSSLIWNNTMTRLVQQEIELTEAKAPKVDKVLYVLFAMFLGCCGCDRCFMGQICLGVLKGATFGAFGIWYLIDYFTCIYCALTRMKKVHMMGYHAKFHSSSVDNAFYITIALLVLQLLQHYSQVKQHKRQMQEQQELLKQFDASVPVPLRHQALAHVATPFSKALRKVGILDKNPSVPELIAAFQSIDKNGDGKLDHIELKLALSNMGVSDEDVDAMIKVADTDGDGKISKGEFLAYLTKKTAKN